MKFVLISLIFLLLTCLAIYNYNYYKRQEKLIKDLIDFFKIYKNEVSFNKNIIENVIDINKVNMSSDIYQMLQNRYNTDKYPNCVNNTIKYEIRNMFNKIGKSDVNGEVEYINNNICKLNIIHDNVCENFKSKGVLRSKLIFIFGIILVIVLI